MLFCGHIFFLPNIVKQFRVYLVRKWFFILYDLHMSPDIFKCTDFVCVVELELETAICT